MKDVLVVAGLAILLAGTAVFTATLEPRPKQQPIEPFYGLSQWELDNQHRPEVQDRIARRNTPLTAPTPPQPSPR